MGLPKAMIHSLIIHSTLPWPVRQRIWFRGRGGISWSNKLVLCQCDHFGTSTHGAESTRRHIDGTVPWTESGSMKCSSHTCGTGRGNRARRSPSSSVFRRVHPSACLVRLVCRISLCRSSDRRARPSACPVRLVYRISLRHSSDRHACPSACPVRSVCRICSLSKPSTAVAFIE